MRPILLALLPLCVSCSVFGKHITEQNCEDWIGQYETIAKKTLMPDLERCHMGGGQFKKTRPLLVEMCKHNVGQKYDETQAKCFMDATSEADWKSCSFKADSAFYGFASGIDNERDMIDQLCPKK